MVFKRKISRREHNRRTAELTQLAFNPSSSTDGAKLVKAISALASGLRPSKSMLHLTNQALIDRLTT